MGLGDTTDISWVEARDATKHPQMLPQQRMFQPKMSVVLRLRNLVFEEQ